MSALKKCSVCGVESDPAILTFDDLCPKCDAANPIVIRFEKCAGCGTQHQSAFLDIEGMCDDCIDDIEGIDSDDD